MEQAIKIWYFKVFGQLVKYKKPCLPGDYVHLRERGGCFKVHSVKIDYFTIFKNREEQKIPWEQFQCLKGGGSR